MYEEKIEALDKWFEDDERYFDTYHVDDEYVIDQNDVDDFCDFLREQNPDLVYIPCMVGTTGIWFTSEDLKKTKYL